MRNIAARYFLIITGWLSVVLGVIGVVLPLLPTTPFILLAGACFAKSSPRFHKWLVSHSFFGPIIKTYKNKQGLPRHIKIRVILFIWITLSISIYFLTIPWLRGLIALLGLVLTWLLWRLPEASSDNQVPN